MLRSLTLGLFVIPILILTTLALAQSTGGECVHTPESVDGVWLSDVGAFPVEQQAAAQLLVNSYAGSETPPEDFLATVEGRDGVLIFHLWHRSAFEPENCRLVGNPGGLCRDVHVARQADGTWAVAATYFWQ